jgi:hypothetical protein
MLDTAIESENDFPVGHTTPRPLMYAYAFMISSQRAFHCAWTAAIIYACTQVMKTKESITVLNVWQSLDIKEFHHISLFFLFVPRTEVCLPFGRTSSFVCADVFLLFD